MQNVVAKIFHHNFNMCFLHMFEDINTVQGYIQVGVDTKLSGGKRSKVANSLLVINKQSQSIDFVVLSKMRVKPHIYLEFLYIYFRQVIFNQVYRWNLDMFGMQS
eukprot:TRINITY_DN6106_c0_g1_i2.p2 TRINITY_DN6106_c0_g1~~TRINITY_DN6106_c0_g1_i2.p2  ORF type:complete len:105 (-),score=2.24 TRINITY_DN6106_c0_g1_i2:100-414(-)